MIDGWHSQYLSDKVDLICIAMQKQTATLYYLYIDTRIFFPTKNKTKEKNSNQTLKDLWFN